MDSDSHLYIEYTINGLNTHPWGVPVLRTMVGDNALLIFTICSLLERKWWCWSSRVLFQWPSWMPKSDFDWGSYTYTAGSGTKSAVA